MKQELEVFGRVLFLLLLWLVPPRSLRRRNERNLLNFWSNNNELLLGLQPVNPIHDLWDLTKVSQRETDNKQAWSEANNSFGG